MAFPDTHDNPSVPAPSTIRASGSGISPAGTVAELIAAIRNLEFKLGLSARVTFTADAGTDTFTSAAHGLQNGDVLTVISSGALPSGLAINNPYYVINITTNTFQLSATFGGSAINITDTGSGTLQFSVMLALNKLLVGGTSGRSAWTDSLVNLTVSTLLNVANGALYLPQGASLAPTIEGSIGWDTDDDRLKIGTGSGTKEIVDTDSAQSLSSKTLVNPTMQDASADIFRPIGEIALFPSNTPPKGWLICNGFAISRTVFSDLFAVLGINYGSGDGATTFNLPDFRGRVPVGPDSGTGRVTSNNSLGASSGAESHQHEESMGFDNSAWYGNAESGGAPKHGSNVFQADVRQLINMTSSTANQNVRVGLTKSASGMNPYQVVNYIIRYANIPIVFADSWTPLAHTPQTNWAQRRNNGIRHMSNQLIRPTLFV